MREITLDSIAQWVTNGIVATDEYAAAVQQQWQLRDPNAYADVEAALHNLADEWLRMEAASHISKKSPELVRSEHKAAIHSRVEATFVPLST